MKQHACIILKDNDESIEINDFFYATLTEAGDEISVQLLAQKAGEKFLLNPFSEHLVDEGDLLDFETMKGSGLIPVVHYYPIREGMVMTNSRHYYS